MSYTKEFLMEIEEMIHNATTAERARWLREYEHDLPHKKHDKESDKLIMAAKNQFFKQEKNDLWG